MIFKQRHEDGRSLLICNVWDVASAKLAELMKFEAIGTSSGAIATMLGYEDGEKISFEELKYLIGRITSSVEIPLSVDLEGGYSRDPAEIACHIAQLQALGVVGVNIEDSVVNLGRSMLPAAEFAKVLSEVRSILASMKIEMFINVRTDTFLMGMDNALEETKKRSLAYQAAGADGIFIPAIEKVEDIQAIVSALYIPVNVMSMPNLSDFKTLKEIGVKRISMGNFLFNDMHPKLQTQLTRIISAQSFHSIFNS